LPDSFSSLFAGGILKSFSVAALLSILNFLRAIRWIESGTLRDLSLE
jgi:hypothetical protein